LTELTEEFVRNRVLEWLSKQGYGVISKVKTISEHGEDIKVKRVKSQNYFIVECKGDSSEKGRQVAFVSALGEIVQRIKHERHYRYAVAFPESYRQLVMKRVPWVGSKRLRVEFLFISEKGKVDRITWRDLKKAQTKVKG
jgi:predicted RNA-binding protein YlqC (UPF0109 family)